MRAQREGLTHFGLGKGGLLRGIDIFDEPALRGRDEENSRQRWPESRQGAEER